MQTVSFSSFSLSFWGRVKREHAKLREHREGDSALMMMEGPHWSDRLLRGTWAIVRTDSSCTLADSIDQQLPLNSDEES